MKSRSHISDIHEDKKRALSIRSRVLTIRHNYQGSLGMKTTCSNSIVHADLAVLPLCTEAMAEMLERATSPGPGALLSTLAVFPEPS